MALGTVSVTLELVVRPGVIMDKAGLPLSCGSDRQRMPVEHGAFLEAGV